MTTRFTIGIEEEFQTVDLSFYWGE